MEREGAGADSEPAVSKEIYGGHEEVGVGVEEEEGAVAAGLEPVGIAPGKLSDLGLGEGQTAEFRSKITEQLQECAVPRHFIDLERGLSCRRSRCVTAPRFEIGINVAENVSGLSNGLPAVSWLEHQALATGNELEAVVQNRQWIDGLMD